ncbi:mitochondrial glycine transporter-like [Corticium candelabrum]|uniref:mitochondrial glycine transporter-like n=1 Tax=Corticium candelabrum TaxID=121492 RepID=UPI002E31A0A1|nr:mitochondrial glycine transporter-like [Corticium candelabrum]
MPGEKEMMQQQQVHKSFLFGCVSGLSSTVLLQPLDVVKTRLQLRSGISSRLARKNGMTSVFLHIFRSEHPLALYKGLLPSMVRIVPGVGIYFSTLTFLSNHLNLHPSPVQSLFVAAVARFCACVALHPFTVIKTQLESGLFKYSGMLQAIKEISRVGGLKGLYRGLGATVARDVPFSSCYFMFYNMMKQSELFESYFVVPPSAAHFLSGIVAGTLASLITHPPDVIKTRLQAEPQQYRHAVHAFVDIVQTESPRTFFSGILPRLIRRTLVAAISWTVYERLSVKSIS